MTVVDASFVHVVMQDGLTFVPDVSSFKTNK